MKIIGITGPTGAGKTTALKAMEMPGVCVLDADAIYHELLKTCEPLRQELLERFGDGILDENGNIHRKKLGAIVFAEAGALEDLNTITHRHIDREMIRRYKRAREAGDKAVVVDAIALVESGLDEYCDTVISVLAPVEVRVARTMQRDGISEQYARRRIAAQKSDDFYRENSDHVFENAGNETTEQFEKRVKEFLNTVLEDKAV